MESTILLNPFSLDLADWLFATIDHHWNIKSMPIKPLAFIKGMMPDSHPINKSRSNWFAFLFLARLMD
jgi:hypothetical protein